MRRTTMRSLVATWLVAHSWVMAAEPLYDAQLVILKTPPGRGPVTGRQLRPMGNALEAVGLLTASWGGDTLTNDGGTLRFNGREIVPRDGSSGPGSSGAVTVLSTPRITTGLGKEGAQVKMGMPEPVQYLAPEADGRFALRTSEVRPEIDFSLGLQRSGAPESLRMSWRYRLVMVGKRVPVPGVTLDVGQPAILEDSGNGETDLTLGDWWLLSLGEADRSAGLAVLIRLAPSR
jgi:hypothetical protein